MVRRVGIGLVSIVLVALLGAAGGMAPPSAPREVRDVRFWTGSERTRVVLDLSGEVRYDARLESAPDRIVVGLPGCAVSSRVHDLEVHDGAIERIRVTKRSGAGEIVIELAGRSDYNHFALKSEAGKPHRIVIDVAKQGTGTSALGARAPASGGAAAPATAAERPPANRATAKPEPAGAERVVIVDPGHGGAFPGTVSRSGIQEKTLTLKLGKMLKADIERHPGYRAVLTRERDQDLGKTQIDDLVSRVDLARQKSGDVYVSLHFNSYPSRKVRGLEVYFLSTQASDENAGAVAERENLVIDASTDSAVVSDELASILFDMSRANAIHGSSQLAEDVAAVLRVDPPIPFRNVRQGPFLVLRGLSMPSILVEGGCLSNKKEAAIISKDSYLHWLSRSLADGIVAFLDKHTRSESAARN